MGDWLTLAGPSNPNAQHQVLPTDACQQSTPATTHPIHRRGQHGHRRRRNLSDRNMQGAAAGRPPMDSAAAAAFTAANSLYAPAEAASARRPPPPPPCRRRLEPPAPPPLPAATSGAATCFLGRPLLNRLSCQRRPPPVAKSQCQKLMPVTCTQSQSPPTHCYAVTCLFLLLWLLPCSRWLASVQLRSDSR